MACSLSIPAGAKGIRSTRRPSSKRKDLSADSQRFPASAAIAGVSRPWHIADGERTCRLRTRRSPWSENDPDSARCCPEQSECVTVVGQPSRLRKVVTCPFFHRSRPFAAGSQTLPSLAASTDETVSLDKPCFAEMVATGNSRKRSSPPLVATQILPSRSSKQTEDWSAERPSVRENTSVRPWWTCNSPGPGADPQPPSRSRSSRCHAGSATPASRYGAAFPFRVALLRRACAISSSSVLALNETR